MTPPEKTCASCGRRIEWRKKWERDWEQVRYCSSACRRRGVTPVDRALEDALLELSRSAGARTVDVSEAARAVAASTGTPRRELEEPARRAARRLVERGEVTVVQRGRVVDPSTAKGPMSVRLTR
ncbi:hypothetical protein SAMN04489844_3402 [Nocardioides exalbidus]|uniref:DUF2256 and DUF3253 domain-containing protein n=1 Tax=Nocardioides exalbidus TaxID=402596 RepID=A0A1H4X0Y7_9ACTN|nr:DUF2256 and DUF3253 domain-containing protein [Nocardioides exalbidus]SEC98511.1 hypothetical protein SAMN04489844_3402 [Nocardioides exalbidus]